MPPFFHHKREKRKPLTVDSDALRFCLPADPGFWPGASCRSRDDRLRGDEVVPGP